VLSGDIKVNDKVIAHWVARRLDDLKGLDEEHLYKASYQDMSTGNVSVFPLTHVYSDGAAVLLQKILEEVSRRQKPDLSDTAERILRHQAFRA
jgi:hypothetical protein